MRCSRDLALVVTRACGDVLVVGHRGIVESWNRVFVESRIRVFAYSWNRGLPPVLATSLSSKPWASKVSPAKRKVNDVALDVRASVATVDRARLRAELRDGGQPSTCVANELACVRRVDNRVALFVPNVCANRRSSQRYQPRGHSRTLD